MGGQSNHKARYKPFLLFIVVLPTAAAFYPSRVFHHHHRPATTILIRKETAATMAPQLKNNTVSLDSSTTVDSLSAPTTATTHSIGESPLLQQRLIDAGVGAHVISFRNCDSDPERQLLKEESIGGKTSVVDKEEQDNREVITTEDIATIIVDIKTLVWEVQLVTTSNKEDQSKTFYVVVALPLEEKANENLLRNLIYEQQELSVQSGTLSIQMAPQIIAEQLTGFNSGCMPPIGHTSSMPLFVDSSIIQVRDDNSDKEVITSIGSGIFGQSLLLPLTAFLQVAETTSSGVYVGSISNPPSPDATLQERRRVLKQERVGQHAKRKDRLKEYRRMDNILDKAKLLRTTVRKKDRFKEVKTLIDEAVATGEYPELFVVNSAEGFSKHALHVCAWRGDFEAIKLMVETSHQYNLDIVNSISTSFRNYGKTAIFYALTQRREDVVHYLVDEANASLLFVNNKGQTPCSIAVSHLSEESCQYLYDVERRQLEAGGTFKDHRKSHSDEKFYGDLDPRFPIDNFNYGEDLRDPLKQFHASVEQADASTKISSVPTNFAPRSLRPTVRWCDREDTSLENANNGERPLTITHARVLSSKEKHRITEEPNRRQRIDISSLELLSMDSVLLKDDTGKSPIVFVNCTKTLQQLETAIYASINYMFNNLTKETHTDNVIINTTWGLDCEWKPGIERGKDDPVAVLQLSTREQSYLVDLQSLCQPTCRHETPTQVQLTGVEERLNSTLAKLFQHDNLPVLGFGILQDLGKLAASFPHLSCFASYSSVIDLQSVSSVSYSKSLQPQLSSLQKVVGFLLAKRLDKKQQCSDWTQRPLSKAQIDYAVLDAAVLPLCLQKIVESNSIMEQYKGHFFGVHSTLSFNLRYTLLDESSLEELEDGHKWVWHVPMGSIRSTLSPGKQMARQCWQPIQAAPELPKPASVDFNIKTVTKKERAHLVKVGTGKKPKPIQLHTIAGNLDNLPIPGITLGYTKDSCAIRVLGHEFMNKLPERTHIGFNRRSGVVETNNAWLLFCNFGINLSQVSSLSAFSKGGKFLTFNLKTKHKNGNSSEKTLLDYIKSHVTKEDRYTELSSKAILLFARGGTSKQYIYCGTCRCEEYTANKETDSVDLLLELCDYNELVSETQYSSSFLELVKWREEVCKQKATMHSSNQSLR